MGYRQLVRPKLLLFIPLLLLILLLSAVAVACGGDATDTPTGATALTPQATGTPAVQTIAKGVRGSTPAMHMGWPVDHWDPQTCATPNDCMVPFSPLYNELMEYNPETDDKTDIRGDLAKSWEISDDGLSYTFVLNEARFVDGQTLTAKDVEFTFASICDPDAGWPNAKNLCPFFDRATVVTNNTVQLHMKFPAGPFLSYLAAPYVTILPKHHVETGVDMKLKENINGTGPFRMIDYQKDVVVKYERNPDYFKDSYPYFDGMDYFIITDPGAIYTAFQIGRVLFHPHINSFLSAAQRHDLAGEMAGKATLVPEGPTFIQWVIPNFTKPPLSDIRMRTALSLIHSRQDTITAFQSDSLLGNPFPPDFWFGKTTAEILQIPGYRVTSTGEKDPADIAEAKRLLAEYEADNGKLEEIDFVTVKFSELTEQSVLFSDEIRKHLGLKVNLSIITLAEYVDVARGGNYDLFEGGHSHTIMEPDDIIAGLYIKGGRSNMLDWTHPRVEELYQLQQRELDQSVRGTYIQEMADIVNAELPFYFHYWGIGLRFVDDRIKNFRPGATDAQHPKNEHMWCDPGC